MPARRKKQIDPLELSAGDYVVHEQHGVGRFVEMKQREVQGAMPCSGGDGRDHEEDGDRQHGLGGATR